MNIVMTGGTSGFGALAVDEMSQRSPVPLILLGGRHATETGVFTLDLASLDSVRAFAARVVKRLDGAPIDALVLNAGLIRPDDTDRSVDGVETTFAVNHLAHHLLLCLLMPTLGHGARVIVTTSGTHDPEIGAGLTPPRHADADLLAHPERDAARDLDPRRAGQHAYTASKLCAVLTVRELAHPRRPARRCRRPNVPGAAPRSARLGRTIGLGAGSIDGTGSVARQRAADRLNRSWGNGHSR